MSRKAPRQGIDLNGGVYRTPKDFIKVVNDEFPIAFDLASSDDNCIVPAHFTVKDDALSQSWPTDGWNWLNPPFNNIGRWARKCREQLEYEGVRTLFLVPASVGSNWYRDYVHSVAEVRFLNGRLTFEGHTTCYPKDLMLAIFEEDREPRKWPWNWRAVLNALESTVPAQ